MAFENIILLHADAAHAALEILTECGEPASLAFLMESYVPGEGTLVDVHKPPWKDGDERYEDGDFILYYNRRARYIGLSRRFVRPEILRKS